MYCNHICVSKIHGSVKILLVKLFDMPTHQNFALTVANAITISNDNIIVTAYYHQQGWPPWLVILACDH